MTILDNNSQGIKEFDNSFIKFSHQYKYFYINQSRKALHIYDLEEKAEENIIKQPKISFTLPHNFETILNLAIDEHNVMGSIIAAKRTDFRNVDFFPIKMILDIIDKQ